MRVLVGIVSLLLSHAVQGAVVAETQLLTPLAPAVANPHARLSSAAPLDPAKPVWVAYTLMAVSASDDPDGVIVIDAALEGVPVDLRDMKVIFRADDLQRHQSAGTIGQQLEAQIGTRSPQELEETFGKELYAAYKALNEKRGSILQGTIVKTYAAPGQPEATLLATVERAEGMQPMMVAFAMGQGDLPPELKAAQQSWILLAGKLFGVLLVGWFVLSRLRKR